MSGRVWKFGDNINTDVLAPGAHMKGSIDNLARHCLEVVDPDFAVSVKTGDVIVAGENFGMGSSREQAAQVLIILGVKAVLAKSFAGIFYRNAFNLGLPVLVCAAVDKLQAGDQITFEIEEGVLKNITKAREISFGPVPGHLANIISDGGLISHLKKRLRAQS